MEMGLHSWILTLFFFYGVLLNKNNAVEHKRRKFIWGGGDCTDTHSSLNFFARVGGLQRHSYGKDNKTHKKTLLLDSYHTPLFTNFQVLFFYSKKYHLPLDIVRNDSSCHYFCGINCKPRSVRNPIILIFQLRECETILVAK